MNVTKEMVDAGVLEISLYNLDFETREDAVTRIFEAMFEVKMEPQRKSLDLIRIAMALASSSDPTDQQLIEQLQERFLNKDV